MKPYAKMGIFVALMVAVGGDCGDQTRRYAVMLPALGGVADRNASRSCRSCDWRCSTIRAFDPAPAG